MDQASARRVSSQPRAKPRFSSQRGGLTTFITTTRTTTSTFNSELVVYFGLRHGLDVSVNVSVGRA